MKKIIRNSLFISAVLMSQGAMADISSNKAQQLIVAADVFESQASMQDDLVTDIGADFMSSFSPAEIKQAKQWLAEEFTAADVPNSIKRRLQKELNDEEADFVLAFLNSDLGKRLNEMEQAGNKVDSSVASKQGEKLLENEEIATFTTQLDESIGASDLALNIAKPIFAVMLNTKLEEHSAQSTGIDLGKMFFDEMVKEAQPIIVKETRKSLAYVYRTLSKQERDQFISFLKDKKATTFTRIMMQETEQGTLKAFKGWLKKMGKIA